MTSAQLAILVARRSGLKEFTADVISGFVKRSLSASCECPCASAESWLYLLLVVMSVLVHHYAQLYKLRNLVSSGKEEVEIAPECGEALSSLAGYGKGMVKTDVAIRLLSSLSGIGNVDRLELQVLPFERERILSADRASHQRCIVEAVTGILNLCDGSIARKNRCSCRPSLEPLT